MKFKGKKLKLVMQSLTQHLANKVKIDPITKEEVKIYPEKISFYKGKIIQSPFDQADKKWELDKKKFRSSSFPKNRNRVKLKKEHKRFYQNEEKRRMRRSLQSVNFKMKKSDYEPGEEFFRLRKIGVKTVENIGYDFLKRKKGYF